MLIAIADDDAQWTETVQRWAASTAVDASDLETRVFGTPEALIQALETEDPNVLGRTVVFLDLDFSAIGASGYDVLRQLKSHANTSVRSVPVVIYSRSDSAGEIEKCYSANANSYVHKGAGRRQKQIFVETVKFWMHTAKLPTGTQPGAA